MDRQLRERLGAWVDAGLISPEQATRVVEHEDALDSGRRRSTSAEAVGYVGAVLAVSAVLLIVGEMWDVLAVGGRLALTVLLTVAVLAAGAVLRPSPDPGTQRLVSVLWLAGVAGTGWVAWVVADDLLGLGDEDLALVLALAVAVTAGVVHLWRHRMLSQLALLVGVTGVGLALLARPALEPDTVWWGLALWGLGVAWALLGAGGWLRPGAVAEVAGTALALFGTQVGAFGDAPVVLLVLGVATAGALAWVATVDAKVRLLAVGALGLFVLVPQLVFELFGDAIGAPATLLVVGLLLVVLAVGLGRVRREVHTDDAGSSPTPGSTPNRTPGSPGPRPDHEDGGTP